MNSLALTYPVIRTDRQRYRQIDRQNRGKLSDLKFVSFEWKKCQGFVKSKSIKDLLNINQSKMFKVQPQDQNLQQQQHHNHHFFQSM